ncbi:lipase family protein [Aldersonia sp. NBC_00410]|uniref:alpha/beta fold hydrolase n=1 Tax=Aldersonia sp. NBC_00410 TaxID=2975954 RepID=UPI00224C9960|nr:alpha/beta fold hydrolase [Aldersonia sp. NBC_00410]MCX5046593.1 lipase family protein [Aldersonia sp. NBC_00410]
MPLATTFRRQATLATAWLRNPPRWAAIVVGLACVAVGLWLVSLPFTSLTVAGLGIERSAPVVAVALAASGLIRLVRAARGGTPDERAATGLFGLAELVVAVLTWHWPEVMVLIVALLLGIRLLFLGLNQVWAGLRQVDTDERPRQRGALIRGARVLAALLALIVAVAAAGLAVHLPVGAPTVDDFYSAPGTPPTEPGQLLRSEPITGGVTESTRAWRILYTTTGDDGEPALASGIVAVATNAPAGPRPLLAWAHGTTGFARQCAPSLLDDPLASGVMPAQQEVLDRGWAVVATDYSGLGTAGTHPYLIGPGEARSVLDSVRAAHQLTDLELSDETVVWGHSQGGHAALWSGLLAPTYAPDSHIVGVAALAPGTDIASFATGHSGGLLAAYIVAAYSRIYPDVHFDSYVRPAARTLLRDATQRCLDAPSTLVSILSGLFAQGDFTVFQRDPTTGAFGARLAENSPVGRLAAPVFLAQGSSDTVVDPTMQARYVAARCADGWNLDYRSYPGRDHVGLVADDSPAMGDLFTWTEARFAGAAEVPHCPAS